MVVNSYVPDRGDIVKLEFGSPQQFTSDSIKRVFTLNASGMSYEDIAETLNNELKQQGREQIGYRPVLVMSPFRFDTP
ncbi:MAG: hypothetical protein ACFKPT_14955 [Gloeotrichia echinulata GP01]